MFFVGLLLRSLVVLLSYNLLAPSSTPTRIHVPERFCRLCRWDPACRRQALELHATGLLVDMLTEPVVRVSAAAASVLAELSEEGPAALAEGPERPSAAAAASAATDTAGILPAEQIWRLGGVDSLMCSLLQVERESGWLGGGALGAAADWWAGAGGNTAAALALPPSLGADAGAETLGAWVDEEGWGSVVRGGGRVGGSRGLTVDVGLSCTAKAAPGSANSASAKRSASDYDDQGTKESGAEFDSEQQKKCEKPLDRKPSDSGSGPRARAAAKSSDAVASCSAPSFAAEKKGGYVEVDDEQCHGRGGGAFDGQAGGIVSQAMLSKLAISEHDDIDKEKAAGGWGAVEQLEWEKDVLVENQVCMLL